MLMLASTQVLVAGPLLPPAPLVLRERLTPPTLTVVEALTMVMPAVGELKVTVHEPVPPAVVQLGAESVPGPEAMAKLIVVPSGALVYPPVPVLMFTWPVKVWLALISLVPSAAIETLASTQVLVAGPLLPPAPLVLRERLTPPTLTVVEALTMVMPAVAEVSVTVHEPVPPAVVQLGAESVPGPEAMAKLIVVPSGALT